MNSPESDNLFIPSYLKLWESGKLADVSGRLNEHYDHCLLCARKCGVNRRQGELGVCSAGIRARVSSAHPHFGEERPLVGYRGSGTIFFSHCNLLCLYCQNWDISHEGEGYETTEERLAELMLKLQNMGCHNINFVTPTHFLPSIVAALNIAVEKGLRVPLVYNTGGYDRVEIIKMLDGVIDIYMPDYKYSAPEPADRYSAGAKDYPEVAKIVLKEMHRQVGVLKTGSGGIAQRGLIIRHLVLPDNLAGTEAFVRFVARQLDPRTYVNIMAQYHPAYRAQQFRELSRRITMEEFNRALELARQYGLTNLD